MCVFQMMEMDSWEKNPVPDDFSALRHMKEFRQSREVMVARAQAAALAARGFQVTPSPFDPLTL